MPPPESLTTPEMALCAETVEGIAANAIAAATMIVPNVRRPTVASFGDRRLQIRRPNRNSRFGRPGTAACYILYVAVPRQNTIEAISSGFSKYTVWPAPGTLALCDRADLAVKDGAGSKRAHSFICSEADAGRIVSYA